MKDNQQEKFPIVDEKGTVIGQATRGECHNGSRLLHPVVHLHVFRSGDLYLQKRPEWKDIQPGKWDTAVGGHIDYGEKPEEALRREVREELGISDFTPTFMGKYVFEGKRERELVYVYRTTYDGPIQPSKDELDGGRFWTIQEIREAMGQEVLTPNFESEFQRFFSRLLMNQIDRIKTMEHHMDRALRAVMQLSTALDDYAEAQKSLRELEDYYGSDDWKQDFADDEAGLLPQGLRRGVLSEDGIWNLLEDSRSLNTRIKDLID